MGGASWLSLMMEEYAINNFIGTIKIFLKTKMYQRWSGYELG